MRINKFKKIIIKKSTKNKPQKTIIKKKHNKQITKNQLSK